MFLVIILIVPNNNWGVLFHSACTTPPPGWGLSYFYLIDEPILLPFTFCSGQNWLNICNYLDSRLIGVSTNFFKPRFPSNRTCETWYISL